jgi:short-subunit dehydrogenase
VIHGCHAFVQGMRQRKRGIVVNVASMAGFAQLPGMAPYNVTKAGVVALSETLAAEVMRDGVTVTVLCPSFFPTNIMKDSVGVMDDEKTKVAEKLMAKSKWKAEDIARIALDAAERGKLYVLPHSEGKWIWRLKRVAPVAYMNLLGRFDFAGGGLTRR